MHPRLSDGQRSYDIEIATENIAGEMFDLQAAGLLSDSLDVLAEVAALRPRYEQLWTELTDDVVVPAGENYCINARLRRLNELGFDVPELTIKTEPDGSGCTTTHKWSTRGVINAGCSNSPGCVGIRHRHPGSARPGRADLAGSEALRHVEPGAAGAAVKLPDAELFHEISEHRWVLSEQRGEDVGRAAAVDSYVGSVLRDLPDTRLELSAGPPTEEFEPDLRLACPPWMTATRARFRSAARWTSAGSPG